MFTGMEKKTDVKCFSLTDGLWVNVGEFPYEMYMGMACVYANGHLHWQVFVDKNNYEICSLNLNTLTFGDISTHVNPIDVNGYYTLCSLNDETLCMYSTLCETFEDCKF